MRVMIIALTVAATSSIAVAGTFSLTQSETQTVLPSGSEDFNTGTWTSPGIAEVFAIQEIGFEQTRIPALYGNWWTADGDDIEVRHSDDPDDLYNIVGIEFTSQVEALNVQAYSGNGPFIGTSGGINIDMFLDGSFVGTTTVTLPAWTDNSFGEWVTILGDPCSTFDEIRFYTPFVPPVGDPILDNLTWTFACPADVNGDEGVGFADLSALLNAWGKCDGCPEDTDCDGTVGFEDLTTLLSSWGPCP